jgi:rSAM/selenodomain-associated transferase 1
VSGAIAIFVKTPGLSPLKTRLADSLGREAAEAWYGEAATTVAAVALAAAARREAAVYWAIAEAEALEAPRWAKLARIGQGEGELGERMQRVHDLLRARHGAAILIGADTPQLSVEALNESLCWLEHPRARAVIGAARDGGFWLFGSNRPHTASQWNAPRYSSTRTRQQFRAALAGAALDWLELPTLTDVDRFQDLPRCAAELARLEAPVSEQRALLRGTQALLDPSALLAAPAR